MINNPIIFYTIFFIIVVFALLSLICRNVINSLLCAVAVFFAAAVVFYISGSEYNAIIQAAIYGLAVPIIIGISVMFTLKNEKTEPKFALPYLVLLASGIFIIAFVYLVMISLAIVPDTFNITEIQQISSFEILSVFAKGLFMKYVWAFELISLLLTIIIAGISITDTKQRN